MGRSISRAPIWSRSGGSADSGWASHSRTTDARDRSYSREHAGSAFPITACQSCTRYPEFMDRTFTRFTHLFCCSVRSWPPPQVWIGSGGGYHLHPAGGGVRLPGGDPGCVFAARDRMVLERRAGRFLAADGAAQGVAAKSGAAWISASFRPRSEYASGDYTDLSQANGIDISMSRKGNPWDHAACESFLKPLKYEEVYRTEYPNLAYA